MKLLVFFHLLKFYLYSRLSYVYRLFEDTAWHPVWKEEFDTAPVLRKAIIYGYGPFRTWMSIGHWCVKYKESYGAIVSVSNFSLSLLSTVTSVGLINLKFYIFLFDTYLSQH